MINQNPKCTSCKNTAKFFCIICNKGICGRCKRKIIAKNLEFGFCLDSECLGYKLDSFLISIRDDSFRKIVTQKIINISKSISQQKVLNEILSLTKNQDERIRKNAVKTLQIFGKYMSPKIRALVIKRLFSLFGESDCTKNWNDWTNDWYSSEAVAGFGVICSIMPERELQNSMYQLIDLIKDKSLEVRVNSIRCLKEIAMRCKTLKYSEIVINCLLEFLADPEMWVRRAALTSLDLGEKIPKPLRGNVVISLLQFCRESQFGIEKELIGEILKNMSEHYDLGEVIPTENRSDIAKLVLELDSNKKLYISYEVPKDYDDWGGNEYNWKNMYPKYQKESIAYLFKSLTSSEAKSSEL